MNEAPLYSKNNVMQRHDSLHVLKRYAKLIKWRFDGEENVLDVGCGDGNVTMDILMAFLPENVRKVVGMDVSKEMVEFAKKYHSSERVKFILGDISGKEVIEEMDEEYNHIFSFFCLHWVQNQSKCAENLYNLLKPGGDMLLTFLVTNPIYDIYENMAKYKTWSRYMTDVDKFIGPYHHSKDPEAEYAKILKQAGFNVGVCKVIDRTFTFTDMEVWRKAVIAVNPFLPRIPENLKQEYQDDFYDEVKRMNYIVRNENNNEENVEARYKLFVVYAYK